MMEKHELSDIELERLLEIARLAPSVHNTQPWKVAKTSGGLEISIDGLHKLAAGDPTGRQTIISLGIFTESIGVAAESVGLKVTKIKLNKDKVSINFNKTKLRTDKISLIKGRATDRSIYKKTVLDNGSKEKIISSWPSKSLKIWLIEDEDFIDKLAEYTSKGISLALSNPEFRKELSRYLVVPWSGKKRGISVRSLYLPWLLATIQPALLNLGLATGKEAKLEKKRWLSASGIVLITTEGDLHADWLEAGRGYLRVSLAIESLGLSQATSAATVEAATFHEDVEQMLGTNQRLQAVIRVGKGAKKRKYSPRVPTSELIT